MFRPDDAAVQFATLAARSANRSGGYVLATGENHYDLSNQITLIHTLRHLSKLPAYAGLFFENPHNRLHNVLVDRGLPSAKADEVAEYIQKNDPAGHIVAKALIGGNPSSERGRDLLTDCGKIILQAAISNKSIIRYVDAARVFPGDYCLDYADKQTREMANLLHARMAPEGQMGPDDMLIRNGHMAEDVRKGLNAKKRLALLHVGAAHLFGIEDTENGLHHYDHSLAARFGKIGLRGTFVSMVNNHTLPPDYEESAGQQHLFCATSPLPAAQTLRPVELDKMLRQHGLEPEIYNHHRTANCYRAEFNKIVETAEQALDSHKVFGQIRNISAVSSQLKQSGSRVRFKT